MIYILECQTLPVTKVDIHALILVGVVATSAKEARHILYPTFRRDTSGNSLFGVSSFIAACTAKAVRHGMGAVLMVTGVLRRQGDRYMVEVPRAEVDRLHLREGEAVALELRPSGSGTKGSGVAAGDPPVAEDETNYLLRSPRNRERLLAALAQAKRGEGTPLSLVEVRKELGLAEEA